MTIIIKRNSITEPYEQYKLERAIANAMIEADEYDKQLADKIIYESVQKIIHQSEVTVTQVHSIITEMFSNYELFESVVAYIGYYSRKAEKRKWLMTDLQRDIWERKYQQDGETFDEWINRVSNGDKVLAKLIREKKFLFGGRILANRGLNRKITYSNCYVLSKPEDNIESIFDTAKKLARTFSYGGGVGIDIEKLRPRGARVNNSAKHTTGAVSFMDLYSQTTGLIGQNGRRGALMISIPCSHPDLEEFIDVKKDLSRVTKANISIRLYDDFMEAVETDTGYTLEFVAEDETITKQVSARKLFRKMAENNWAMAEPGALFWNEIERWNLLSKFPDFEYSGVNPCAEEPLPAGGSCLLGSINLAEFVRLSFTKDAYFDYDDFKSVIGYSVRALNDVLDEGVGLHPLEEQRESAQDWRQIGLGIMGLSDMLIKLGMRYGSHEAVRFSKELSKLMANSAMQASAILAHEKGKFPKYNEGKLFESEYFQYIANDETKKLVSEYGLRNSQLLTVAPTGSISTMIGISGGIEPTFAFASTRKTESLYETEKTYKIYAQIIKDWESKTNGDVQNLPSYFVESHNIPWEERIEMQSAWQMGIDASISSTINLPNKTTVDEIVDLYIKAWRSRLKGLTIYRDGCERAGILAVDDDDTSEEITQKNICPECGKELNMTGGCSDCPECGWSKCSL